MSASVDCCGQSAHGVFQSRKRTKSPFPYHAQVNKVGRRSDLLVGRYSIKEEIKMTRTRGPGDLDFTTP